MDITILHPTVILPIVGGLIALLIGFTRYQFLQVQKELRILDTEVKNLKEQMAGLKFNYLDRFDGLKVQIAQMNLSFTEKIVKLTTLIEQHLNKDTKIIRGRR